MRRTEPFESEYKVFTRENILHTKENVQKLNKIIGDFISYVKSEKGNGIGEATVFLLEEELKGYILKCTRYGCIKDMEKCLKYKDGLDVIDFAWIFEYLKDIDNPDAKGKYIKRFIDTLIGVGNLSPNWGTGKNGFGDKKIDKLEKELGRYIATDKED